MNSQSLGRLELLAWINEFTQCDYPKIENLCDGIAYCQIIDAMHPTAITLSKLNFNAKYKEDFQKNLKLLDEAFNKAGIDKIVPIDKLSQGKFQDNMTFLQWFSALFLIFCFRLYNYSCQSGPIVAKSYRGYERRINAIRKQKYNKSQTMNAYLLPNNAFMKFNSQQQNDEPQNQMMQQQQQPQQLESSNNLNSSQNQKMDQRLQYLIDYTQSLEIDCKQKMEYNWKLLYAIDDMLYQRNTLFKILQEIEQVSQQQQESELKDAIINILYYIPEDFQKAEQQQQGQIKPKEQRIRSSNEIQQPIQNIQITLKSDQNIAAQQHPENKEKPIQNVPLPKYMQQQKYFGL